MVNDKSVLAIIPARGGSKGVPRKNILHLAGRPLLAWTVDAAKQSRYIDRVVLSSEDAEIIRVAREAGCDVPFVRPTELAQDDTPGIEPVLHALTILPGYDYVVLLQPTSPLRTAGDIDRCIELCVESQAPACVSVTEPDKSPYWMYTLSETNGMTPILDKPDGFNRRQDLPKVYALNGAVYVAQTTWLQESRSFIAPQTIAGIMAKDHSLDIDTERDFIMCELMVVGQGISTSSL